MPFPDYLDRKPRLIFFTDFDGTITTVDVWDWLVMTEGYGPEELHRSNQAVMDGTMTFREASREQLESIQIGLDKCIKKAIAHLRIDDGFIPFYQWAVSVGVPIVILSGGLVSLIEAVLKPLVGDELLGIEIVANEAMPRDGFQSVNQDGGSWTIDFRDDTVYGNDKAQAIRSYAEYRDVMAPGEKPILLFAGDGVSDIGAAKQADLLFAKQGQDLAKYCRHQRVPFVEYRNWKSILRTTQDLLWVS
ncbi:phosphoserine phosphatase [Echria macrotheca]|uniref:Phosphoserine phosphatase n=1 Tax=Echria macrotheca TaxID=438768 RepID=A0AAJ0F0J3_9PEZI|nr:phosphoserine phosphatase [Echria macrotheca]